LEFLFGAAAERIIAEGNRHTEMTLSRLKQVFCLAGAAVFLVCAPAFSRAELPIADDVTELCEVTEPSPGRAARRLTDGNVETYTEFSEFKDFRCVWGEDAPVAGMYLKFYQAPGSFVLTQLDAAGEALSEQTVESPLLNAYYPLETAARGVLIHVNEDMSIGEVAFYSAGNLPEGVYDGQPPADKADLLVISAHCDDELLYFGGTIPTYAGEKGLVVQVAYMANEERLRMDEAMNGLWLCKVRNAPVLVGMKDAYTETLEAAEKRWGRDETVAAIVSLIRRFKPEVIVTHDLEGEYGHGAHRITASCTLEAVSAAADGTLYPESAQKYGAWQTKKLYLHLFDTGAITMDWRVPLDAFDGLTALDVANLAYDCHVSQQEFHQNVYDTGDFSSAEYGLAYTQVGQDVAGGDFFENIPLDALSNYVAPTPSPTPEPTPTPTVAPTPSPTASPEVAAETPAAPDRTMLLLAAGVLVLLSAGTILLIVRTVKKARRKRKKVRRQ